MEQVSVNITKILGNKWKYHNKPTNVDEHNLTICNEQNTFEVKIIYNSLCKEYEAKVDGIRVYIPSGDGTDPKEVAEAICKPILFKESQTAVYE